MPIRKHFFQKDKLLITVAEGAIGTGDIYRYVSELESIFENHDTVRELIDARRVTDTGQIDSRSLAGVGQHERVQRVNLNASTAIVVSSAMTYGFGRVFLGNAKEDPESGIVTYSLEEAVAWLGKRNDRDDSGKISELVRSIVDP